MNAFRIYFLVIVLVGGFALALTRLVPAAVADQSQQELVERARLESVFVQQAERLRVASRSRSAAMLAADTGVRAFLTTPAADRVDSALQDAVGSVHAPGLRTADTIFVVNSSGAVQALLGGTQTADMNTWAARSRAAEALDGSGVTTYFTLMGGLFAARAEPVFDERDETIGAVVVVDQYDNATIAGWRSGTGTNSAFFSGVDVLASNFSDTAVAADVGGVVRRTASTDIGTAGNLALRVVRTYDERVAVIAPVHLGDPATDYSAGAPAIGVVLVVDSVRVPSNLPAVLVRLRAFDEGTGALWLALLCALLAFLGGLALLDNSIARAVRQLSGRIGASATDNDPVPLPAADYAAWIRPVAEAFNGFLEAYRSHSPTARRSRAESSAHLFMVDTTHPERPATALERARADSASLSASGPVVPMRATAERSSETSFERADQMSSKRTLALGADEGPGLFRIDTGAHAMHGDAGSASGASSKVSGDPFEKHDEAESQRVKALVDEGEFVLEDSVSSQQDMRGAPWADSDSGETKAVENTDAHPTADVPADGDVDAAQADDDDNGEPTDAYVAADEAQSADEAPAAAAGAEAAADGGVVAAEDGAAGAVEEELASPSAASASNDLAEAEVAADDAQDAASELDDGVLSGSQARADDDWASLMQEVELEISGANAAVGQSRDSSNHTGLELSADVSPVAFEVADASGDTPEEAAQAAEITIDRAPSTSAAGASSGAASEAVATQPVTPPRGSASVRSQPVPGPTPAAEEEEQALRAAADFVSELEREGDSAEVEAIVDPQQSRTVPRVSLRELNARARAHGKLEESGDQQALLAAAEQRLRQLQSEASQLPGVTRPTPTPAPEQDLDPAHRPLYDEFRSAKVEVGEDVERLTYEKFLQKLDRNRNALKARYNCTDVRFEVAVRNGKVTLKATPVR